MDQPQPEIMSKLLITALTFTVLAFVAAGGYHLVSQGLKSDGDAYGKLPDVENSERHSHDNINERRSPMNEEAEPNVEMVSTSSVLTVTDIILKVPTISDKEPDNPLSGIVVTGYQDVGVAAGDEFIITPTYDDLQNRIDTNTVLSERFRLIEVKNHTIELERYATRYDTNEDGDYEASPEWQKVKVTTKACFDAVTMMLDVSYQLCLDTTEDSDGTPILTYEFIGQSTMPGPND